MDVSENSQVLLKCLIGGDMVTMGFWLDVSNISVLVAGYQEIIAYIQTFGPQSRLKD